MARPSTGSVRERTTAHGTVYALRFSAYGSRQFVTLGGSWDGWTHERAELELQNVLADVRRGIWRPPTRAEAPAPKDPTFHEFASDWFDSKQRAVRTTTADKYRLHLVVHLLPFFKDHRLSEITKREVDRYRDAKLREGKLSAETINMTIARLAQILDVAVDYDDMPITTNAARGKGRRLKATKPRPVHLDGADQIIALIDAAADLDERAESRTTGRRALIATLVFAGLRASEASDLLWRDVDLAAGRLEVGHAKTDAGVREIDLLPVLRDELLAHKAASKGKPDALVFRTAGGGRRDKGNINRRVLRPVVARATELLAERDQHPLPLGVTPHKLRHTFASVLIALGRDPSFVMGQLGHTDPRFTLRVYTHLMRRGEPERDALKALVEGRECGPMWTSDPSEAERGTSADRGEGPETRTGKGETEDGHYWARTSDPRLVRADDNDRDEGGKPHQQ